MALWPFVIFRSIEIAENKTIHNHESIHLRQQIEMLLIPYYILYFIEYWLAMITNGFKHQKAYLSISFEREAYEHETNLSYLNNRKWLSSWTYIKRKFK
ncbi:MAG: hypothetical protein IT245_00930 [Bacteroidia bacterium]|nr:hypothetical protein [Bacteroidia bacterium]